MFSGQGWKISGVRYVLPQSSPYDFLRMAFLPPTGHSREDASLFLAVHQPLDELRISGLAFRLESIHFEGHKCIQRPVC